MKKQVTAAGVYSPNQLFSHAISIEPGRLMFVSGMLARDPATGAVGPEGDVRAQTRQVFDSIARVLAADGASLRDITKMTVYLKRRGDYAQMNAVRREVLQGMHYASTTVIAELVDEDALVEIEAVARLPDGPGAPGASQAPGARS
jgi:2-iminobutanoate/2-iminopropanoate deaminase